MTTTRTHEAVFAKLTKAAASGDQVAQDALDALAKAAEIVAEPADTGAEAGRAEARRRFGALPGDAA